MFTKKTEDKLLIKVRQFLVQKSTVTFR